MINNIKLCLIFLIFEIIFCDNYILSSYEVLNIKSRGAQFLYQLENNNIKDNAYPYLFFGSSFEVSISIKVGENNIESFNLNNENNYYFFRTHEYMNLTLTIEVNSYNQQVQLIFFDNSKEININFEDFLGWNYNIKEIENMPLPIIFNLDTIQETTTIILKDNTNILHDTVLNLEYCLFDDINCEFKQLNDVLTLEKRKNYKFKLNPFGPDSKEQFSFDPIPIFIFNIIKEVEFGPILFNTYDDIEQYFIVDIFNKQDLNLFIMHNDENFYLKSLTEEEKQQNNTEDFYKSFTSFKTNKTLTFDNADNKPFLVISILYNSEPFKGSISFFNGAYEIRLEETLEFKKGNSSLIEFTVLKDRKYAVVSGSKCLSKFTNIINPRNPDNVIIYKNEDEFYQKIYVNASKEDCKVKLFSYGGTDVELNFNLFSDKILDNIFKENGYDSLFGRNNSKNINF